MICVYILVGNNFTESQCMCHLYNYMLLHVACCFITDVQLWGCWMFETYWCKCCTYICVFWTILAEDDVNKSQNTLLRKWTAVNFTVYAYIVGCYDILIVWYMAVTQHCDIEWCFMWPGDITVEYCTWSDMWYSFRICLTCTLNKTLKWSVFFFCWQLLQWMMLSVVMIVQYHQYQLPVCHLNVNTRTCQDVSTSQRWDFVYWVVGEGKWDHFRLTSLMVWILKTETVRKTSHLKNMFAFFRKW